MKFILNIIFLIPIFLSAQDITGVWTGYIRTPGSQLKYELAISGYNDKLSGYSLIVYVNDGVENLGIKKAKIKQHKNHVSFEDGELVYDNFTSPPKRSKLFGDVLLEMKDSLMILRGSFATRSLDMRDSRTYSGEIFLQKDESRAVTKMLPKLEELKLASTLSFMRPRPKKPASIKPIATPPVVIRKTQKIRDVEFNTDSLVLNIYDNGTIDGDTVSLVLNGKVIADRVPLRAQAHRIVIPSAFKPGDSLQLVMYAESLGSIPPNTGLLIINDGDARHEILFESDLQKSAVVTLRRRK